MIDITNDRIRSMFLMFKFLSLLYLFFSYFFIIRLFLLSYLKTLEYDFILKRLIFLPFATDNNFRSSPTSQISCELFLCIPIHTTSISQFKFKLQVSSPLCFSQSYIGSIFIRKYISWDERSSRRSFLFSLQKETVVAAPRNLNNI